MGWCFFSKNLPQIGIFYGFLSPNLQTTDSFLLSFLSKTFRCTLPLFFQTVLLQVWSSWTTRTVSRWPLREKKWRRIPTLVTHIEVGTSMVAVFCFFWFKDFVCMYDVLFLLNRFFFFFFFLNIFWNILLFNIFPACLMVCEWFCDLLTFFVLVSCF